MRYQKYYSIAIAFSSLIVICVGLTVIAGWIFNLHLLTQIYGSYPPMKFNTAILFILLGLASQFTTLPLKDQLTARALTSILLLISVITLAQDLFNADFGIDQYLMSDKNFDRMHGDNPGRMAPLTAINFILIAISLLGIKQNGKIIKIVTQVSLNVVTMLSFVAILGYVFNVSTFYRLAFLSSTAIHTAICFFITSMTISLFRPSVGLTGLFTGDKIGNMMARRLFLQMVVAIVLITYLRIQTDRLHLIDVEFGIVLFALCFIIASLFLIWKTSDELNQIDNIKSKLETNFEKIKIFLDSTPDPILIINAKGIIQIINQKTEEVYGYVNEELIGKHFSMLTPGRFKNRDIQEAISLKPIKFLQDKQFWSLTKSGIEIPTEIRLSTFRNANENFISVSVRDISERKKMLDQLTISNNQNRIFIEQSPNAIAMFDNQMNYMAASHQWLKDYNIEPTEIIGQSHYQIFPEIGEDWKKTHQDCLKGAIDICDEAYFQRLDGSAQWIKWEVRPWFISTGVIGGLIMHTANITEAKKIDEQRRRIEYILMRSNQIAKIAHWEIDVLSGETSWSQMANEIFEFPKDTKPDKLIVFNCYKKGKNFDNLVEAIRKSTELGIPYDVEIELVTKQHHTKWLRIIGEAEFKNDSCIRRFGIFQDISKSKSIENELNLLNAELKAIFNSSYVSIIGTDLNGKINHFNRGSEYLLQYEAAELVGKQTPEFIHDPLELENRGVELTKLLGHTITGFDILTEIAKKGIHDSKEWTYIRKDGSRFPVQLAVTAIRTVKGEISGYLGVATDISVIKNAEKELALIMVITKGQNERLKNFAHIVSHNLRSHSSNFSMLLDLMCAEYTSLATNPYIELLNNAANNLKETIANLNEVVLMNNAVDQNLVPINLKQRIKAVISDISMLTKQANAEIHIDIPDNVEIMGIQAYLDSILLNFITNGIKYRSADRKCRIDISMELQPDFVIISIQDNGLGIDLKKNGDKLFGMYKTFHGNKDARGIGLFITKNQIEAIGGKIEVSSEINIGSTFKIYLKHEKEI